MYIDNYNAYTYIDTYNTSMYTDTLVDSDDLLQIHPDDIHIYIYTYIHTSKHV